MVAPPPSIVLPTSYASLPTSHISLVHVPESSPSPTSVILVTLNRPEKNNAFTDTMTGELERVFNFFNLEDRVKCIVLRGAGQDVLCGCRPRDRLSQSQSED